MEPHHTPRSAVYSRQPVVCVGAGVLLRFQQPPPYSAAVRICGQRY